MEFLRHQDLDRLIHEIPVGFPCQVNRVLGSDFQGLLQAGTDLRIAELACLANTKPFKHFIELSRSRESGQENDYHGGNYSCHHGISPFLFSEDAGTSTA